MPAPAKVIDSFRGAYSFLSNFHLTPVRYHGSLYSSAEQAYQAAKCEREEDRQKIMQCKTPGEAKKLGKRVKLRAGWDGSRLRVMAEILEAKFQSSEMRRKLLETGEAELIESNGWCDVYWGRCNGEGENWLGELLMALRDKLREEESGSLAGRWWVTCPRFTVALTLNSAGVITEAEPMVQKFIGQHRDNLTRWAGKFGPVRWERLEMRESITGLRVSVAPAKPRAPTDDESGRPAPDIPATPAQIRKLCAMIGEERGEWVEEEDALQWIQDVMPFGEKISDLRELTNGMIGKCFEELGE